MVKYQFFVGSTYKDLVDERQVAINAIIETNNIVAGMEFFGAVGENQLEHIKQEIDQTDYYLLIIGGRYGSLTKSGISYTEEEYDYAVLNGVRVSLSSIAIQKVWLITRVKRTLLIEKN